MNLLQDITVVDRDGQAVQPVKEASELELCGVKLM